MIISMRNDEYPLCTLSTYSSLHDLIICFFHQAAFIPVNSLNRKIKASAACQVCLTQISFFIHRLSVISGDHSPVAFDCHFRTQYINQYKNQFNTTL